MSALSEYYIHYNYENYKEYEKDRGWPVERFAAHIIPVQTMVVQEFEKKVMAIWGKQINNTDISQQKMCYDVMKVLFPSSDNSSWLNQLKNMANDMVKDISLPTMPSGQKDVSLDQLQKTLDSYKDILQQMLFFLQNTSAVEDTIFQNIVNNTFNHSFSQPFPEGTAISVTPQQYNMYSSRLQAIANKLNTDLTLQDVETGKKLAWVIYNSLNIAAGFMSEDWISTKGTAYVQDYLQKILGADRAKNYQVTFEGTGNISSEYLKATTDISLKITDTQTNLSIQLPFASVKRGRPASNQNSQGKLHLKTGTTIQQLVDRSQIAEFESAALYGFLQAYATRGLVINNYEQKTMTKAKTITPLTAEAQGHMQEMYNYMHMMFLPTVLAGDLSANDLATVFVFNNQIYTIADILRTPEIWKQIKGFHAGMQRQIRTAHQNAWVEEQKEITNEKLDRSETIKSIIMQQHINISILKTFFLK